MLFFNAGARFSIGVLFKPMLTEFGWSRGTLSLALFLNMTVFALAVTAVDRLYNSRIARRSWARNQAKWPYLRPGIPSHL